ncbi:MAG: hypothetical protein IJZ53_07555 [Tyzzerella sp.]|nr:hypothetical protein [Tyzzerella sp.]
MSRKINDIYDVGKAFNAIEDELISSMIRNMERHKVEEITEKKHWEMWQALQIKSLERYRQNNRKKYNKEFASMNQKIAELIRIAKQEGSMEQEIKILQAIKRGYKGRGRNKSPVRQTMTAEFFKLNERKLEALIKATTDDMKKAETAILRMSDDQYRKIIFNAQVYANTGAGTYEKAVDMATKDFLAAGLNCVEYSNGARHTLSDYADMAIRTASKRAYLQGEGEKRQEWGITTVIMNKRGNPCPKCLPFCGKILIDDVWSGGKASDGPYPLMSKAIETGLYHPRCKDSHTTYFEGISTSPDDKYSKKEIEQIAEDYREEQKQWYVKRQVEKFGRLEKYSLDSDNQKKYRIKSIQWKKLQKPEINDMLELSDKQSLDGTNLYSARELIDMSSQINKYMNSIGLPNSKWSGKTFIKSISEMPKAVGVKKKACDIWLREDAGIKTIIHEHLHARSGSWLDKWKRSARSFEESTCELLAQEICKQNNIAYNESYKNQVASLRQFNKILGKYSNDYEFALDMFNVDMDKREKWLTDLANESSLVKSIQLKALIRKVHNAKE